MDKKRKIEVWHEAYRYLAEQLAFYFLVHKEDSSNKLFEILFQSEYGRQNEWLKESKRRNTESGVDPIQLFASLNNSGTSSQVRFARLSLLLEELDPDTELVFSEDFFDGCPTPVTVQIISTRKLKFQNEVWNLFTSVVNNGLDGLKPEFWLQMKEWYGIDIPSFTIFLFWIDSENFLPLDGSTVTYLSTLHIIDGLPKAYDSYINLCKKEKRKGVYRELVKAAYYNVVKKTKFEISEKTETFIDNYTISTDLNIRQRRAETLESLLHEFRLIAIKPTRKNQKHIKNLDTTFYKFYESYDFIDGEDKTIEYNEGLDNRIYSVDNIDVSISSVVGKNGSGKSALTELLFLAINKISKAKLESEELLDEEVFVDLYFITDGLYKISVKKYVTIYKYKYDGIINKYELNPKGSKSLIDLSNFFYTVAINYSAYGLNSNILGDWITPLFHKNDSYQIPFVLNPKRTKGNIDVNVEDHLSKARLLSFILEKERYFENNDKVELLEGKEPVSIKLEFDSKKLERQRKKNIKYFVNEKAILEIFLETSNIKAERYVEEVKSYIFYKLISITEKYLDYKKFSEDLKSNNKVKEDSIRRLAKAISKDTSHIVFKIKQAIYYLEFAHIDFEEGTINNIKLADLARKIEDIKQENFEDNNKVRTLSTILLIPPSIFKVDIIFKGGSSYEQLSSGEKQLISSINTVVYHLYNINSVSDSFELIKYRYVNVLFDEVELYFHPDMQRKFIYNLLAYLRMTKLQSIFGINFLFITHSPFILSDIHSKNILRLKLGNPQTNDTSEETFGANVHEILHNDFFLNEGFMGEYAKQIISDLYNYLASNSRSKFNSKLDIKWDNKKCYNVISIIGEPLLKERLMALFRSSINERESLIRQKEELEKRIAKLDEKG